MEDNIDEIIDKVISEIKRYYSIIKSKVELEISDEPSIYYILHVKNLHSILDKGILSHRLSHELNSCYVKDISNVDVNSRRSQIKILNRSLHDYVPFYFNPRNAMLYSAQSRYSDNIIILELNIRPILKYVFRKGNNHFLCTNGNASRNDTSFCDEIIDLLNNEFIDFSNVFKKNWYNDERIKSDMMSEILIYHDVPIEFISYVHTQTEEVAEEVIRVLGNAKNLEERILNKNFTTLYGRGDRTVFFDTSLVI